MRTPSNIWILTEERPKKEVIQIILSYFAKDHNCGFIAQDLVIIPILNEKGQFTFTYEIKGFNSCIVKNVYTKIVSGAGSFIDFLIFFQDNEPTISDTPIYAIEETKTDDRESRNTGVYQRSSKFIFIDKYYPSTKKIMLYALQIEQKKKPTSTYIFGTRLLLTLGVEILGKYLDPEIFFPFKSIDDVVVAKNSMRQAPKGNVPIHIKKNSNTIFISGRLIKNDSLSHDPNIGALSIISAVLRKLGWTKDIVITKHGIEKHHIKVSNKFIQIANLLNIKLQGLEVPKSELFKDYWHYDFTGEKLGTIFLHIAVEYFTHGYSIFENHAGCEKSYFETSTGEKIPLAKYADRRAYKSGNKDKRIFIPDLVLLDKIESEIITIEGKKYKYLQDGINKLPRYDAFEKIYLRPNYPRFKLIRIVVLYGSNKTKICNIKVGFLLNENGDMILGIIAPGLFCKAIRNLKDYWTIL